LAAFIVVDKTGLSAEDTPSFFWDLEDHIDPPERKERDMTFRSTVAASDSPGACSDQTIKRSDAATLSGRLFIPAICDVSVTNACNANCSFCSFACSKAHSQPKAWIDTERFIDALPIMHRRGIRYLTFQGGEPLLHPDIAVLVSQSRKAGMQVGLITNGFFLPQHIESLVQGGVNQLHVSIDSHSMEAHERNRGLPGIGAHVREGVTHARRAGIMTIASVVVSRLVDFDRLPPFLLELGFEAVNFSYPRRENPTRLPLDFGAESPHTDYHGDELAAVYESIKRLKKIMPVINPTVSLEEMARRTRGEKEHFSCVGGHKYFCLDWNLDIWRCEYWSKPMGSVFDLDSIPDKRDPCTACTISCYRDASVLLHAGIAAGDAAQALLSGRIDRAIKALSQRSFFLSLRAIAGELPLLLRLSRR
jgi:MoaA/NifB/PqqE/SkfB family radical SAM enzyme